MTRRTELRSGIGRIGQRQRLVRLMTSCTVVLGHGRRVWRMAIHTGGDIAVGIGMTEVAGKGCMLARAGNHLLVRAGMAGDADGLVLAGKIDFQWLVWIVATEAFVNFVMGTARMTVAALGDIVGDIRTMSFVTGLAVDFRLVGSPIGSNLGRLLTVTFGTIVNRQYGLLS